MYRKIDPSTPTADLLALRSSKPFLIELAQEVFSMRGSKVLHAFRQFDPHNLAKIIDAKRSGVWDYGKYIEQIQGGYKYPKADDALAMLEDATGGTVIEFAEGLKSPPIAEVPQAFEDEPLDTLEVEQSSPTQIGEGMDQIILPRDIRRAALESMNKRPLQQLHLVVTGSRSTRGEEASRLIERILEVEFAAEVKDDGAGTSELHHSEEVALDIEVEHDYRPRGPRVIVNTFSPEESMTTDPEENIVRLSDHTGQEEDAVGIPIASAIREDDELDFDVENVLDRARAGIRGVFVLADIILRRQDLIAEKLFGGAIPKEWPEVPTEGIIEDFEYLTGEDGLGVGDSDEVTDEDVESSSEKRLAEESSYLSETEIQDVAEQGGELTAHVHYTEKEDPPEEVQKRYLSESEIRELPESDLYEYAESIGIGNARAIAFAPFLVRDVLKKIRSLS